MQRAEVRCAADRQGQRLAILRQLAGAAAGGNSTPPRPAPTGRSGASTGSNVGSSADS